MRSGWTAERDALFRQRWAQGAPAAAIAAELGGVSSGAITGRAHWYGLKRRRAPIAPAGNWPDERIARLKQLWGTGSGSAIAAELGVSKNAVIGKAHRLGLERLGAAVAKGDKHPGWRGGRGASLERAKHKSRLAGFARRAQFKALAATLRETPPEDAAIPVAQRASLLDLTMDRCHWPVGDPVRHFRSPGFSCLCSSATAEFYYCGGGALPGYRYCRGHCLLAYHPAAKPTPLFPSRKRAS